MESPDTSARSFHWFFDSPLFAALTSLNLHQRMVSFGLDGSITFGAPRALADRAHRGVWGATAQDDSASTGNEHQALEHIVRAIVWRIYLRVIPFPSAAEAIESVANKWTETLYLQRAWYAGRRQTLMKLHFGDDVSSDPQEMAERLYANEQSSNVIVMDIHRSYQDDDPSLPRATLFTLLSVWSANNKVIGYHQGMHEIAGQCLQLLQMAKQQARTAASQARRQTKESLSGTFSTDRFQSVTTAVRECCSERYVEADAYVMFDAIMSRFGLATLYATDDDAEVPTTNEEEEELMAKQALGKVHLDVRDKYLPSCDPQLHQHLQETAAMRSPFLFMARWIRNLFTREVSTSQCFVIWDAFLAMDFSEYVKRKLADNRLESMKAVGVAELPSADGGDGAFVVVDRKFSPLDASLACVLLTRERDALLSMKDDFSILRHLTRSPIVSPALDPYSLLEDALTVIARDGQRREVNQQEDEEGHFLAHFATLGIGMNAALVQRRYEVLLARNCQFASQLSQIVSALKSLDNGNLKQEDRQALERATNALRQVKDQLSSG